MAYSLPHTLMSADRRVVYSADETVGNNDFLNVILNPRDHTDYHIPDFDMNQKIPKSVLFNSTIASNIGQANFPAGNTDILIHVTPQSKFAVAQIYANSSATTGAPNWKYISSLAPDQVLSTNFSLIRYVAQQIEIFCSTIASGAFAIQGQIWGVAYQDCPSFFNLSAQQILASRKDEQSYVENHELIDGLVGIGDPSNDFTFTPPETNAITNDGPSLDLNFINLATAVPSAPTRVLLGQVTSGSTAGAFPVGGYGVGGGIVFAVCVPGWNKSTDPGSSTNPTFLAAPVLPNLMRGDFHVEIDCVEGAGTGGGVTLFNVVTADNLTSQWQPSAVAFGGGAVKFGFNFIFTSPVPVVAMYISEGAGANAQTSAGLYYNIRVNNKDVLRVGEISNGQIFVLTGLPTPSSAPLTIAINSVVGYEAVPNFNLAQNVKTVIPRIDNASDIEAAKVVFANKEKYGIRSIYCRNRWNQMFTQGHFEKISMRSNIRQIAFGLDDIIGGIKSAGRALMPFGMAALSSSPYSGLAPIANALGTTLLSADSKSERKTDQGVAPRRVLLCSDGPQDIRLDEAEEKVESGANAEKALESWKGKTTITHLLDPGINFLEDSRDYHNYISPAYQASLDKTRYAVLKTQHKSYCPVLAFSSFPTVDAADLSLGRLLRVALSHTPFRINFAKGYEQMYDTVSIQSFTVSFSKGHFDQEQQQMIAGMVAKFHAPPTPDMDKRLSQWFITLGAEADIELSGGSLTMCMAALFLGVPNVAAFSGSRLTPTGIFTPVVEAAAKLQCAQRHSLPLLMATEEKVDLESLVSLQIQSSSTVAKGYLVYDVSDLIPACLAIYELKNQINFNSEAKPSNPVMIKKELANLKTKLAKLQESREGEESYLNTEVSILYNTIVRKLKTPGSVFSAREQSRLENAGKNIDQFLLKRGALNEEEAARVKAEVTQLGANNLPGVRTGKAAQRKIQVPISTNLKRVFNEEYALNPKGLEADAIIMQGETASQTFQVGLEKKLSDLKAARLIRGLNYQNNNVKGVNPKAKPKPEAKPAKHKVVTEEFEF